MNVVQVTSCPEARNSSMLENVDAVLLCDPSEAGLSVLYAGEHQLLSDILISHRLSGIILSADASGVVSDEDDAFVVVPADISVDELFGRLAMVQRYRPFLRRFEDLVHNMQRLGKKLNQQFVEVDQELQLASRLQRELLPQSLPEVGDYRFAALYLPASWVSGDVYDVRRLDEENIGIYLADAVGHGVAAGLLTMFIKQTITGKRVESNEYVILDPSDVMANLNTELAGQKLIHSQFATACYAVINTRTSELTFSRAGHPYPIHVSADGECRELKAGGGLLGIFEAETFPNKTMVLQPGEKFIMYSDGMEYTIISKRVRGRGEVYFAPEFQEIVRQPAQVCVERLAEQLEQTEGSIQPADDMTALVVERLPA
ncbi:MAG: PP2C family protein-serine/threonine phosphatase [Planctomycetota bacterium]